ncbi:SH3 domain-containing protein [Pontibacter sp. G13]|uniref:SH3 domain-containing protein n=1 Tax=Pontibacter sp. G13 TaxID=3074898 RepID=UPI00288A22D9|nr:SH3 domain-containing protein [Pontibacter sp. G13]WNJ20735.1 SH3 domain-containing protein [Pontibacter sp. G13]
MKNWNTLTLLVLSMFFAFTACSDDAESTDNPEEAAAEIAAETEAEESSAMAFNLWPEVGLRQDPGRAKGNKYLATIKFGEVVELTGKSEVVDEKTYLEMRLSDGKEGYAYEYLFAVDAERCAALQDIDLFDRPDLTTLNGKKIEKGEIFALIKGDKAGWVEVIGREKKRTGWIQDNTGSFSMDEMDVAVGIMLYQALAESSVDAKTKKLELIAGNASFGRSPLAKMADELMAKVAPGQDLPANQLMVTAEKVNVREEPNNEAENVVFQMSSGDVAIILERGEQVAIRDMNDYWYMIEFEGQEGWIYGHFTSKKQ